MLRWAKVSAGKYKIQSQSSITTYDTTTSNTACCRYCFVEIHNAIYSLTVGWWVSMGTSIADVIHKEELRDHHILRQLCKLILGNQKIFRLPRAKSANANT